MGILSLEKKRKLLLKAEQQKIKSIQRKLMSSDDDEDDGMDYERIDDSRPLVEVVNHKNPSLLVENLNQDYLYEGRNINKIEWREVSKMKEHP